MPMGLDCRIFVVPPECNQRDIPSCLLGSHDATREVLTYGTKPALLTLL